jgi:hypothetical protein
MRAPAQVDEDEAARFIRGDGGDGREHQHSSTSGGGGQATNGNGSKREWILLGLAT